jgi:hypothetical protein
MRCIKTGDTVEESRNDAPGFLWQCDRFRCVHCGHEVLVGFGNKPIAEPWDKERWSLFYEDVTVTYNGD